MTAPLPPHWLDVMPETRAEVREYAEEYAKLAVREALERVIQSLDCDATARAMLKEYE